MHLQMWTPLCFLQLRWCHVFMLFEFLIRCLWPEQLQMRPHTDGPSAAVCCCFTLLQLLICESNCFQQTEAVSDSFYQNVSENILCDSQDTSMISILPEKLDWLPTFPISSRERLSVIPSPNSIWQLRRFSCFSKLLSSCQLRRESPRSPVLCRLRRRTASRPWLQLYAAKPPPLLKMADVE